MLPDYALASLADLALDLGKSVDVAPLLTESLGLAQDLGRPLEIARVLELFSGAAAAQNHFRRSVRLEAAAGRIRRVIGEPIPPDYRARLDRRLVRTREAIGEELVKKVSDDDQAMTLDQAIALARSPILDD